MPRLLTMKICPECGGTGEITRRVPAVAMAFQNNPDDWKLETKQCWRCKGDGCAKALGIEAVRASDVAPEPDRIAHPASDEERAASYREIAKMHPANRFRLMFGQPLLTHH